MENKPEWMRDPMVAGIDEKKLAFLSDLVFGGKGKTQQEIMPYMMSRMKQAKADNVTFSSAEITTVITAIKKHSTPEELAQIDQIMKKAPTK